MARIGNVRWRIAMILGLGVLINYFDRTNISVATKPFMTEYHLSAVQMGFVLSAFAWSYALFQIPIGVLIDKIGVKWLIRVATFIWGAATLMTAVVSGMGLIILSRVILGAAEAPAFSGAAKATGYWFPVKERGRATIFYDAAGKFSNVISTPLVAWAATQWGWRGGFYLTAALSIIYAIIFWVKYCNPTESTKLQNEEREYIVKGGAQEEGEPEGGIWKNLVFLLKQRKVWGLTLGYSAYGYLFYLVITWLPGYLENQMHMSVLKTGLYVMIPWLFATIADVLGGYLTDKLIERGYNPTKVRKYLLVTGGVLCLAVAGAAFTTNANVAISFITIALVGQSFASPIGGSIPSIIAPKGTVALVLSILNFVNNGMAILAPILTGFIVGGTGSFAMGFILAAVILVIGVLSYIFLMDDIVQIKTPFSSGEGNKKTA